MSLILFFEYLSKRSKTPYYNTQEQALKLALYIAFDNEMNSGELKEWATSKGIKGAIL